MSPSSRAADCLLLVEEFSSNYSLYYLADLREWQGLEDFLSFSVCRPRHFASGRCVDLYLLRLYLAS